jgi:hypothetical protein
MKEFLIEYQTLIYEAFLIIAIIMWITHINFRRKNK